MSKAINLAVVGTGLVGSAFLRQLNAFKSSAATGNISLNVILIARSNQALISKDYSPIALKSWESDLAASTKNSLTSAGDIAAFLERSPEPVILVDNTSSESLANSYPFLISQGISITTPNKKAFSSDMGLWNNIFNNSAKPKGGLVYHEATVGAGLPIIGTLRDLVSTGDEIHKIEGILSGTLSYIFNEYSKVNGGSKPNFSDVVSVAKDLGYTEPDPREDLNGLDVARKFTILSRIAGYRVPHPTAFPVRSLIPKPLRGVETAEEFLEKLPKYDNVLEKLRKQAEAENKVIRYVGKIDLTETPSVHVSIEKYEASHPFASLKGSDNVIAITTKRYPNPLIIQGAGAGAEVTAAGVLADTIKASQRLV